MHKVYLGIGGNLGNKQDNFANAFQIINDELGEIDKYSSVYETPPWGFQSHDTFWNCVILVHTDVNPEDALTVIQSIEQRFGRERKSPAYESREMDIDILYYDDLFMETENLIIPHPFMHQRKFVLVPLCEIAPDLKHPLLRLTSIQLLENCKDESVIKKIELQ